MGILTALGYILHDWLEKSNSKEQFQLLFMNTDLLIWCSELVTISKDSASSSAQKGFFWYSHILIEVLWYIEIMKLVKAGKN